MTFKREFEGLIYGEINGFDWVVRILGVDQDGLFGFWSV